MFDRLLLKRNDALIAKYLKEVKGAINCDRKLFMVYPERYYKKQLASIDNDVTVLGIVLVMDENHNYAVFKLMNKLTVLPTAIDSVVVDDKPYSILEFEAPNFIASTSVIEDPEYVFVTFEEFFNKPNIPFFVTYSDLFEIFTRSAYTSGSSLGLSPVGIGLMTAAVGKDKTGKKSIRSVMAKKDIKLDNFRWVALSNVDLAYDNNVSRLLGSYLNKGVTAALADEDPERTSIEDTLRL